MPCEPAYIVTTFMKGLEQELIAKLSHAALFVSTNFGKASNAHPSHYIKYQISDNSTVNRKYQ